MQWHKNKILVFSAVYVAAMVVIASLFGMWHNAQLNSATSNYLLFLLLLVLLISVSSFFYLSLIRFSRKEIEGQKAMEAQKVLENEEQTTETETAKEEAKAKFDQETFIAGIVPTGKKTVNEFGEEILQKLAGKLGIVQGVFYTKPKDADEFEPVALYAYYSDQKPPVFKLGENITGQSVKDKRVVTIQNIPENYIPVVSGLGSSKPRTLVMVPLIADNEAVGLIEMAVFTSIDQGVEQALKELGAIIGKNIIKLMK